MTHHIRVFGAASSYVLEVVAGATDLVLRTGADTETHFPAHPGTDDPGALVSLWRARNPGHDGALPDYDTFAWLLAVAQEGVDTLARTGINLDRYREAIETHVQMTKRPLFTRLD